ncbi:LON peptidase substrate-binding domain-containing protein [uncultured Jatrophihabitans sp.]|uniref:LON peptidase substrate-binding domain-containing protein n=1 Tax=uncultured Jatrophihabitans sp. TaxID=1610747 RepID=UPI0035CC27E9
MSVVVPMFPLSHVLLPGMPLPLHVFEQRYRDMLADIGAAQTGTGAFGVVSLRSGTEARQRHTGDGPPDVEPIGTLAEILEIETADDGSADLLCVGSRRFTVHRLITDGAEYLRAEVDYLDEDDGDLRDGVDVRARELLGVYDEILQRLAGRATGSELPTDASQLSYQIAARLPLGPIERQQLLADPTTAARLARVGRLLRREIALLRGTRSIAVSPAVLRMSAGVN